MSSRVTRFLGKGTKSDNTAPQQQPQRRRNSQRVLVPNRVLE
ncbi:hypothetical protein A2U01_0106467, partial [Trifolium medium]|nr:hypothetical protein [Trifolium medium]